MIRQYIVDNHRHWDKHLGEFRLAINSAVHDSTGYSPAFLNFGRELKLPNSLLQVQFIEGEEATPSRLICERSERFRAINEYVRRNLSQAHKRQASYYNLRRRPNTLKVGQQVLCRRHDLSDASKGFTAKLAPKFDGPYTIVKGLGVNIFHLKSDSGRTIRAHVKDLKPYLS
ncbi:uncharacterized protein LOC129003679 [Macrosteles quadrilineatus]|uniref:uncharacterized protein LOC129003679 n=1 Tax=Macrosteles quadrilineatus TaxID=74068 RepID=UPI0023E2EECC|nr:uncharacterized protein LOC129003679 [Macrosteles quadrilineatus]